MPWTEPSGEFLNVTEEEYLEIGAQPWLVGTLAGSCQTVSSLQ